MEELEIDLFSGSYTTERNLSQEHEMHNAQKISPGVASKDSRNLSIGYRNEKILEYNPYSPFSNEFQNIKDGYLPINNEDFVSNEYMVPNEDEDIISNEEPTVNMVYYFDGHQNNSSQTRFFDQDVKNHVYTRTCRLRTTGVSLITVGYRYKLCTKNLTKLSVYNVVMIIIKFHTTGT